MNQCKLNARFLLKKIAVTFNERRLYTSKSDAKAFNEGDSTDTSDNLHFICRVIRTLLEFSEALMTEITQKGRTQLPSLQFYFLLCSLSSTRWMKVKLLHSSLLSSYLFSAKKGSSSSSYPLRIRSRRSAKSVYTECSAMPI